MVVAPTPAAAPTVAHLTLPFALPVNTIPAPGDEQRVMFLAATPTTPAATAAPLQPLAPTPSRSERPFRPAAPTLPPVRAGPQTAPAKIGFHTGPGGHAVGVGEWLRALDAAGLPFFIKSVDEVGPLLEAQQLAERSGVPHTLVYRRSGPEYDVPDYSLNPIRAARQHWRLHTAVFPPELDPALVWLETINEVDKNRSEWLALFALETARLALRDGYKWAAFGWSAGEPEIGHWQGAAMLAFLRLAAGHPDQLAVALHEYSFTTEAIVAEGLIGRFEELFAVCDDRAIPRPTVLITEWGWSYQDVPPVETAMQHIAWADALYALHPEIRGAAIWYLGGGYGHISVQTQQLIQPLTRYALNKAAVE
jgi:hypothetical protein